MHAFAMAMCSCCQRLPQKLFSFARDSQCTIDHQPSYLALEESATIGCPLCKLFVHAVKVYVGEYASPRKWRDDEPVRISSTKFGKQLVLIGWAEAGQFRGHEIPENWSDPGRLHPNMQSDELHQHEAAVIKSWTETCINSHAHCSESEKHDCPPTRLVDVGEGQDSVIRLILTTEAEMADRRYLALSHCWGKAMPPSAKTTLSTLNAHRESIDQQELPQTFKDFIDIARTLRIRYVWIDSLCIIQDSPSDWEREAAQMATVYSNAYFTIAASGSADGRGGCRIVDEERSYGPFDLECAEADGNASENEGSKRRKFRTWSRSPFPITSILYQDPLTKRGWTLQERELSPRVVHYSRDNIRWECRDLKASLEFPWGDTLAFNGAQRLFDNGQLDCPTLGLKSLGKLSTVEHSKAVMNRRLAWFDLVNRYTSRNLTRQTDILPAISGIAQAIGRSTSEEYYVGLWKSYFPLCMLWASAWHIDHGLATHRRPSTYIAPSWSWASVEGHIEYLSWMVSWHSYNPDPDPAFTPNILGITLDTTGSDPYGMVKGGKLHIEGKVRPAMTRNEGYAKGTNRQDRENVYVVQKNGMSERVGQIRYDIPLCSDCAPPGRIRMIFILCCLNSTDFQDGTFRTYGIALQPVDLMRKRFVRVGLIWDVMPEFWKDALSMDLTVE